MKSLLVIAGVLATLILTGCSTTKPVPHDYTAFKASKPRSILVLPPTNSSPDVNASHSLLTQTMFPLSEAGYYVFPIAVVEETFKQNGMTNPQDMHNVSPAKLREIFAADSAMYIDITHFGTTYQVLDSVTQVAATAKLVDLRTGKIIWSGSATRAISANQNSNNGILVSMINAAISQISNNVSDKSHEVASMTASGLLSPSLDGASGGIMYGPRSPMYLQSKI